MEDKRLKATARLLEVMNTLRRECPWDREQTFDSLRSNTIEEIIRRTAHDYMLYASWYGEPEE